MRHKNLKKRFKNFIYIPPERSSSPAGQRGMHSCLMIFLHTKSRNQSVQPAATGIKLRVRKARGRGELEGEGRNLGLVQSQSRAAVGVGGSEVNSTKAEGWPGSESNKELRNPEEEAGGGEQEKSAGREKNGKSRSNCAWCTLSHPHASHRSHARTFSDTQRNQKPP